MARQSQNERLRDVNKSFYQAHLSLHSDFMRTYRATLAQFGLKEEPDENVDPEAAVAFHAALAEAKQNVVGGMHLALEAHKSGLNSIRR